MKWFEAGSYGHSFSGMSPEVIEFALEHGAAKIDNLFSEQTINSLAVRGLATVPSLLVKRAPELQTYFDILGISDYDTDYVNANVGNMPAGIGGIHTDIGTIVKGVSLLFPLAGDKAVFGACNETFTEDDEPGYVVEYGIGDAIVLRQGVEAVNSKPRILESATHVARCATDRTLVLLDFHSKNIMLNAV